MPIRPRPRIAGHRILGLRLEEMAGRIDFDDFDPARWNNSWVSQSPTASPSGRTSIARYSRYRRCRGVTSRSMPGSARWPGFPCTPAWRRGRINARSFSGYFATSVGRLFSNKSLHVRQSTASRSGFQPRFFIGENDSRQSYAFDRRRGGEGLCQHRRSILEHLRRRQPAQCADQVLHAPPSRPLHCRSFRQKPLRLDCARQRDSH